MRPTELRQSRYTSTAIRPEYSKVRVRIDVINMPLVTVGEEASAVSCSP